ncbi:MAG: hypothetical protein WKI04_08770 [Ferruginibacter sp.]
MTTQIYSNKSYDILSSHGGAEVRLETTRRHHSLHAVSRFNAGEIITNFYAATVQSFATYLTVQTGSDTHITLEPSFLQYVNHGCDPNVFFDTTAMQLVCISAVQPGDEFRFFYPSTEWEMAQPFVCDCGSKNCLQLINGAAHINPETLAGYRLTDFILQKLAKKS